jgi:hypothetical protein
MTAGAGFVSRQKEAEKKQQLLQINVSMWERVIK